MIGMRHFMNLFEARMSLDSAINVFAKLGVNVDGMSTDEIAKARRQLVLALHQSGKLTHDLSVTINTAFDDLKYHAPNGLVGSNRRTRTGPTKGENGSNRDWPSYVSNNAFRENMRDKFDDLAEPNDMDYEIVTFDGNDFNLTFTAKGHPDIFNLMVDELLKFARTRFKVQAVFAYCHEDMKNVWLVYLDGKMMDREVKLPWNTFRARNWEPAAGLSAELDKIRRG